MWRQFHYVVNVSNTKFLEIMEICRNTTNRIRIADVDM